MYVEDGLHGWDKIVQFNSSNSKNFYMTTDKSLTEHPKLIVVFGKLYKFISNKLKLH